MHRQIETSAGGHAARTFLFHRNIQDVCFPDIFVGIRYRMLEILAHNIPRPQLRADFMQSWTIDLFGKCEPVQVATMDHEEGKKIFNIAMENHNF